MCAFGSLRESQDRVENARHWYSQALLGFQKTFGLDDDRCETLGSKLELLICGEEGRSLVYNMSLQDNYSPGQNIAASIASLSKLTWQQHRTVQSSGQQSGRDSIVE
jgi:hypothetical protein